VTHSFRRKDAPFLLSDDTVTHVRPCVNSLKRHRNLQFLPSDLKVAQSESGQNEPDRACPGNFPVHLGDPEGVVARLGTPPDLPLQYAVETVTSKREWETVLWFARVPSL